MDDGSGTTELTRLKALLADHPWVSLVTRAENGGKGAATITGLRHALAQGFTHIILVDADGQHDAADVARLLQHSLTHPDAVFSGNPQFGDDIPAARRYGREITNILARLEAGNPDLRDAMCGLRVYPIATTLELAASGGKRMELDTELLVRACWAGVEVRFVDTNVVYPPAGASHFRMGRDNFRLVVMHIKLLLQALLRVPLARFRSARSSRES